MAVVVGYQSTVLTTPLVELTVEEFERTIGHKPRVCLGGLQSRVFRKRDSPLPRALSSSDPRGCVLGGILFR